MILDTGYIRTYICVRYWHYSSLESKNSKSDYRRRSEMACFTAGFNALGIALIILALATLCANCATLSKHEPRPCDVEVKDIAEEMTMASCTPAAYQILTSPQQITHLLFVYVCEENNMLLLLTDASDIKFVNGVREDMQFDRECRRNDGALVQIFRKSLPHPKGI